MTRPEKISENLKPFEKKWVAIKDGKVIASGETVKEVKQKADSAGHKNYVFYLVPPFSVSFAPSMWV